MSGSIAFPLLSKRSATRIPLHRHSLRSRPTLPAVHCRTITSSSTITEGRAQQPTCHATATGLTALRSRIHLRPTASTTTASAATPGKPRSFGATTAGGAANRMASDGDYIAFLDKANQDPGEGRAQPQGAGGQQQQQQLKATDDGAQIPAVIADVTKDSFYVSDADEPFLPVYLAWDEGGKGLPDEEEFASLIRHPDPAGASIEILDPAEWDPRGQYAAVVDAVRAAGAGNDVRVYRVPRGGARVEYWVVATEGKGEGAKLVGAKALAIES
ncbi:hypothetical protein GGS23DRAFT_567340 [Durotheca rogersii]|uniref:uncharacterized protein n=1 Tax=Durotheca rogersii TaxID=419775 RepID=UPI002220C6C0|nr:uncharacterized protein GGS23DRAFT_567340 [Durotheca rogersii]KAI5863501.1 hypothetical protein GGS23DRAFT_567340 [Durotheca rogersii]